MTKIVYNNQYGGFSLSVQAVRWLASKGHVQALEMTKDQNPSNWYLYDTDRDDPLLVECVEQLGVAANGECASLKVISIPPGHNWDIDEFDGLEEVRFWQRSVRSKS